MKTISIGHYVGAMGNVVLEQQTFIKKLLNTLQLIKPQSQEFTNQLNLLKQEYEEATNNHILESNENMAEFDAITPKIQKDLEAIHVQLRVLKSANASSRKGQGQPDLTALEKNKKLKESFKEYKAESSLQISNLQSALAELKSELKNSHEMMTNIQANIQASRDEFDTFKSKVPTEDQKEEMNTTVNDMQVELEAIKTVLEVMHQGTATTEDLERVKKSQTRSVNILKNSMQNVKDEIKNIKLLKQGKIPPNVLDLVESLDQSVNSLQDEMEGIKKDVDDKSSLLTKAQQDLVSLMSEMEKLRANPSEIDTSSLPINERMNLIEERVNTITDHQLKADNNFNAQRAYLKYIKEEFATDIVERVTDLEKRLDELHNGEAADQKKSNNDEYQHLDQKITQMINDLESSNIQERAVDDNSEKPDFPHTVEELRSFQKALRDQAQDDENSIYQYIEPSNLPVVVQSMDQLVSEMYSEMYQIRDKLTNEISELKQASNPQTIKCLKHELKNVKQLLDGIKQQNDTVPREIDINQSETMQWPVLRSPGKKKEPSPFVEGLKSKIQDLVEDMNNAEGQEDEDINQIKPTMGEAQAKLNNMLTVCNNIIDQEVEDEIEQITPEKMWEAINDLKSKVTSIEEKEEERLIKERDIQLEEEEVDEVKEAIEELKKTSQSLKYEIKQLKEKNETQEALAQIDEKMNSLTERINEISGHQSATESTINAHTTHIRQQANQIQDKLNQIEELEKTLNEFISTHHENDDQSIASMKAELEELKGQLTSLNQSHEEHGNTLNTQIGEIHQKLKEFEEGAFFKSSPKANPIVQQLQEQIAQLIKQMEDSQLQNEEDATGELRPTFSQAQEQLETVQKTLDEILAQENERLMMESPSELVKNVQNLNNKVRMLEEGFSQSQNFEGLQQRSFSEEEAAPSIANTQTRAIDLTTDGNDKPNELVYELRNRIQVLENTVNRLSKQHKDATDLINKRHNSLKKVKATVNEKVTNRLDKIEDDLNHHITDHPISQDIQVAVPPDSYVKSKPNPIIQALNQQIDEVIQKIETEELESLATSEMNESGSHLKPELDTLKEQLTKLQETLRKVQEQQIYVPAAESLQGIADTISALQDKVNNQSNIIRELKDQSDIKNNESLGQLKEEIKSLRNHVKTALQNEENLSNELQDKLLPISQKVESLERQIDNMRNNGQDNYNFQESNIPLVERSVSDIYNSGSPNKKKPGNMTSIEALKTSIEQLVEKIDDDKLNEEEDTTGELKNNLGQTRKDLATLQSTLDSLIRKANDPAFLNGVSQELHDLQTRVAKLESGRPIVQSRDIQLDGLNDDEVNQLKENVDKLNTENEELKHDIKCLKYEVKQLRNTSQSQQPASAQGNKNNNNVSFNLDDNDSPVDLLRQELSDLRNQLRVLNEQENTQQNKVEQMQDQIDQLVKDNASGFFSSAQPKRRQRSKAVFEIKDHVDNLLNEMSDPNIQEEAGDSEDLKPSMDQAQEDLEKLQVTLNSILAQTEKATAIMTPEGFYKLVTQNQSEIHVLAENGQEVNKQLCQLTETVRCLKHEVRKMKNEESEFDSFFKSPQKEVNPAVTKIQSQIDILSRQLDESDLTESDTKERDLNGKVTQTQENLKSLREALQSILDADESEQITPDNLVSIIRDLRTQGILMQQEIKNSQNTIDELKSELHKIQDAQAEEQENSFEDKMSETVDAIRVRVDEVSANQIKIEENVKGQLQRLRDYKSEIDQVRAQLAEIKEMLSSAEEWMCITDQTKPEENKASPLVESLTQQIDKLVEDLNKPDMQTQTSNNGDLEERRTQAQTQLSLLREALERAKEAQQEPLTFTPTSLLEAIKDLRNKVAYLEFVDGQKVAAREINLEEEEQVNDENDNQIPPAKGFPEKHYNPVIEEINEKINSLVQTLHHPDMEENDTNGEIQPQAASTENELRILRKELDFLLKQQEEMDALTPENLYKAICNLQVTAIRYEDSINSINCLKHEVKKLRHIELTNTNAQLEKLRRKSKDVKKMLNTHLEENQRIINEINSPRKKRANPAIEAVKREIETLNEKMNDPSFTEEEGNDGLTSGELSSRKQQAQQHLDLLSETLTKLLEQKEPAILNMDTLHQMIHDLQTKIAFLEAQNEQSAKETSEEMQNILRSMKDEVHHLKEEQEVQNRDINLERDNKLDEIEGRISELETRTNEVTGSQQTVLQFVKAQKSYIDEFKNQQQSQKEQENDIENRVSQLEQTVESFEEVSSSFVNFNTKMNSSRKPNPKTEELKNQIDIIVSQMEDPSLLEDDTQGELNPAMDKAKDELQVLRNVLDHLTDEDGNFSPQAFIEVTQGLESRIKVLEDDKQINVQTRGINLESEQKVDNLSESFNQLKSSLDSFKDRLGNTERNEEEIKKNVEEVCKQIDDIQSRLGEVESQPSQIIAGFNTFKKRPINPSMEALRNRIDELVQQMNDPELQNEEENKNSQLKPTISNAEAELRRLQETLNRLMEQEEPVGITPESLLALIHQLQAKVAELEVISSHGTENHDAHKQETQEKFDNLNQDLTKFVDQCKLISENQAKLVEQFNQFKSKFSNFEEQVNQDKSETTEKIGTINENIDDIQSHITELETQPTQYLSGFPENQTLSRPVNPVIRGIQNRIDELVQEMNDPTLQDEDNKSNEELQTNMTNAESELQQLNATLKHLMEQEEPIVVTPESLLDMVHNLQAQVASLEATEDIRKQNEQKERTLNLISQNQSQLIDTFNNLKSNLDEFKTQLHDTNLSGEEMDKNVDDLCQKIEETQNKISEFESLPTALQVSGFTTSTGNATPVIQAIQKRIDELIKEMNHPSLQNEDNEANTRLKPSMTKAENELLRLQETLKKLEEEDQITPNKLYGMIQSTQDRCQGIEPRVENVENKVDDHIENHPTPQAEWTVKPREASQAVQALKNLIDEICENMQVPVLNEDDEASSQLKPTIENAQTELIALQQKVNDILQEQERPAVLTPERIYHKILDLQSSVAKIRKEQIQQQRKLAQEKAAKQRASQIEEEESENDTEEFNRPTTIKTRSINLDNNSNLENEIEELKQSVAEIKSQIRQQQLSSPVKEYRNLKQFISSNPPKTEAELVSYIDRLEKVAEGFDRNIVAAQGEIKKVGQIKNQLKEDGDFAKSLQQEIRSQSNSIKCIKHELKLLKSGFVPSSVKSRDVSVILDNSTNNSPRRRRSARNQQQQPSEEEQVKALQDRLSSLEYKMDSLRLQYKDFDKQQHKLENSANQIASYEALNTSINKFVERNNDSDDDEDVEKLHPDIENTQIKLRALKGSLDDVLNQQRQNELAIVTPQSLNADLMDVKKHVEKTENDINDINDRIDTLDENQEQTAQSFNDFKAEIDNSPKVTQEILDYIDDLPNQLAQIKSEIAQLQEAKESHQNELQRLSQCINELTEEDKKKTESINQLNQEINGLKEALAERDQTISTIQDNVNNHSQEISNLHEKDASISREIEELKSTVEQNQQQNEQQFNQVKQNIEQNQLQNNQKFNEISQNINSINSNINEINTKVYDLNSTVQRNQQQNEQQFNEVKQNISSINSNVEEVKSTVQQNQEQNNQQFNNIRENISTITTEIDNLKTTVQQNQEQNVQQFNEVKQSISSINSNVDELNSTVQRNQQQNEQQFNEVKQNISSINSNVEEVKSTVQQNQEQNNQQFNNIRENISTITTEIDNLKTTVQQNQEQNNKQFNTINQTISENQEQNNQQFEQLKSTDDSIKQEISSLKQNLNNANENINNLVNQRKEDQQKVQNISNNVESLNTTTQNLTNEIANLKQSIQDKEDTQKNMITSQSKNIEYIQKVLTKHEKHIKALYEKQKGVEDLFQQNDPVSKDDFSKLEMKYDKLIEQIHSNISVIANGQQSQQESFKKELNNMSQNNSELPSEASLGAHQKEGVDDLTKKVMKIFKHVKSQDEKINKLRTDVDGLLNA